MSQFLKFLLHYLRFKQINLYRFIFYNILKLLNIIKMTAIFQSVRELVSVAKSNVRNNGGGTNDGGYVWV